MDPVSALQSPFVLFDIAFAQRALIAGIAAAVLAGILGPVIVLRDLSFFSHAVGAGAYPALVIAVAIGASVALGAIVGALSFAVLVWVATRRSSVSGIRDAQTGIAVARALAVGAILAVVLAGTDAAVPLSPETLLFGSVLTVDATALFVVIATTVVALATTWLLGGRWLATGFDAGVAGALRTARFDGVLLTTIAVAVAATLPVTGSLLAGALLIVPATTARILTSSTRSLTFVTLLVAVTAVVGGLYVSLSFDLPAGAAIATVAGGIFVLCACAVSLRGRTSHAAKAITPATATLVLALLISGCGSGETESNKGVPVVVATTSQAGDLVRQIAGNSAFVTTLLRPGVDPHNYEPRPSDILALTDARVIFKSGGTLDSWLDKAARTADSGRTPVDLSDAAVLLQSSPGDGKIGHRTEIAPGVFNPHWFLDPANLKSAALRVRDELIKANPAARETYRANTFAYLIAVDAVDDRLRACVSELSRSDRVLLAGHNDFEYLARRYKLDVAAQLAPSGGEVSLRRLREAERTGRRARAVLVSVSSPHSLASEIAKRLGLPLVTGYADSLGPAGSVAETALGAIEFNVGAIVEAVTGGRSSCATR